MSEGGQNRSPLSNLVDARVRTSDGVHIGVVDELLIDLRTGRIEYLLATDDQGRRLQFRWSAIEVRGGAFVVRTAPGGQSLTDGGRRDAHRN